MLRGLGGDDDGQGPPLQPRPPALLSRACLLLDPVRLLLHEEEHPQRRLRIREPRSLLPVLRVSGRRVSPRELDAEDCAQTNN